MKESNDDDKKEDLIEKLIKSNEESDKIEEKEKNDKLSEKLGEEEKSSEKIKEIDDFGIFEKNRRKNKKNIFCTQIIALMKKTIIIFIRHYKTTILIFSSPFLICFLLILLQFFLERWTSDFIDKNPPIQTVGKIPRCPYPEDCTTIMTVILDRSENEENRKEVETIMRYVAEKNDLDFGRDVNVSKTLKNSTMLTNYLNSNKNKTYFGVIFCYDYLDSDFYTTKVFIPCKPQFTKEGEIYKFYSIVYNMTNGPNDFVQMPYEPRHKDPKLIKLKTDLDNAYLELFHNNSKAEGEAAKIYIDYSDYPKAIHRFFDGTDFVNNFGLPFFVFIPMILFLITLIDIVKEKQLKLRISLLIIGLKNSAFWSSWFLVASLFSVFLTLLFLGFVYLLRWELFINTPFPIMFVLFFLFIFDLQLCAFLMSTLINNMKMAYASAFGFIIVTEVFVSIFTVPFMYQLLYANDAGLVAEIFKGLFYLFCPFNFSKAFLDIAAVSSTKLSVTTFRNMPGRLYEYSDLFEKNEGDMVLIETHYIIPAAYESFIYLFLDSIIYTIFIFYFDNVIKSNRGKEQSPIFFIYEIGKIFGICKSQQREINEEEKQNYFNELTKSNRESTLGGFNNTIEQSLTQISDNRISTNKNDSVNPEKFEKMKIAVEKGYQTVIDEYNKIKNEEKYNKSLDGLRIVAASKIYNLSRGKKLKALQNIFLDVTRGELLSLLGHSGAGKTTLINALVGNISLTEGYAKINDINITDEDIESKFKNKLIGLCPQHNIVWEELTAYENIELYASIRNYAKSDIPEIVKIKMKEVNLEKVTNDKVSTFSDGMKRRISILLSTVGNPNVVFLDEPSTGLDPVNRRFIWNMIKEIKKKSSVILTTHSMSEAEFLSDRICVIKKGAMQCIGTSLDLKNIYGEGYILSLICNKDCHDQVKNVILGLSEDINLISSKGENLLFSISLDKIEELNWFIKILNKDFSDEKIKSLKELIKACEIEQTSIEEIFLKITKEEREDDDDNEIIKDE